MNLSGSFSLLSFNLASVTENLRLLLPRLNETLAPCARAARPFLKPMASFQRGGGGRGGNVRVRPLGLGNSQGTWKKNHLVDICSEWKTYKKTRLVKRLCMLASEQTLIPNHCFSGLIVLRQAGHVCSYWEWQRYSTW